MPRRNIDGLGPFLRSHDAPDDLLLVSQQSEIADVRTGFIMLAREPSLSASERRDAEPQSGMARQADAARMGPALTVEHHGIGTMPELAENLQNDRHFPAANQTAPVRELAFPHT